MSVVSISEMWQGRGWDGKGRDDTTARRQWRIRTNNKFDSWQTIGAFGIANGYFPNRYDPHPENFFLRARGLKIENQSDSPLHWIATADYSSAPLKDRDEDKEEHEDPCDRKAKITWNTTIYQAAVEKTIFGYPLLNSAGQRPDRLPEKDASHWTCSVSKNVRSVPSWILDYNDCPVNDDSFEIGGIEVLEGKARLYTLSIGELQRENGYEFYVFGYTLEFRKEGWKIELLDEGLCIRNDDDELEHITVADEHGETSKVSAPQLLDGLGRLLANPTPENAVYLDFSVYEPKDFSVLPKE